MRFIPMRELCLVVLSISAFGFAQTTSNIFNHFENGRLIGQETYTVSNGVSQHTIESKFVLKPTNEAPKGGSMNLSLDFDLEWNTVRTKIDVAIGPTIDSVVFHKTGTHVWQQNGPQKRSENWSFGTDSIIFSDLCFAGTYEALVNKSQQSDEPRSVNILPIGQNEGITFVVKHTGSRKGTFSGKRITLNKYILIDEDKTKSDKYELSIWIDVDTNRIMRISNINKSKPMLMDRDGFRSSDR